MRAGLLLGILPATGSDRSGVLLGSRATSVKTNSTGLSPESEGGRTVGGKNKGRWVLSPQLGPNT